MRCLLLPVAIAVSILGSSALAQTVSGDAVRGKPLFDNTGTASGNTGLASCTSCHGSVEARRSVISQNSGGADDPYADISFDTAMTRLNLALQGQQAMAAYRVLTAQQVYDIAAYLADTPKTTPASETQLSFSAALNGNSAAQAVTLKHATATGENLQVLEVAAYGAGAANFVLQKAGCEGVTLTPGLSCQPVSVTFAPSTSGVSTADLVFTLRQGPSTNPTFERVLPLSGSVAAATAPADDSGGGALGLAWLAALGAAVAALSRRRRG